MDSSIAVKDLVLVGGGHAHVHTLKMFGMNPMPGVRVTLITRDIETPYSGMLPGFVAGFYSHEECHIDLGKLCNFANARMLHVEANGLDVYRKEIYCSDGRPPIKYDVISIDIGISPKTIPSARPFGNRDVRTSITPVKPIDRFANRWDIILERVLNVYKDGGEISSLKKFYICVVGGGAGGVELAFALHQRIYNELKKRKMDESFAESYSDTSAIANNIEVKILTRGNTLVSSHSKQVQEMCEKKLVEKGITVCRNAEVVDTAFEDDVSYLVCANGQKHEYHETIWCTQGTAQSWLKDVEGLKTTSEGFICVKSTLESVSVEDVFACGDVAHYTESPRPKAGVFAVRAGPPLTANIRSRLLGETKLEPWTPQDLFLGIIGTGDGNAIATKGPLGVQGEFVWKLKDKIDRLWMTGYQELPDKEEMMKKMLKEKEKSGQQLKKFVEKKQEFGTITATDYSNEGEEEDDGIPQVAKSMGQATINMLSKRKMRCGGCGSKIGANVLSRALARIKNRVYERPEILAGIARESGDDAALVVPPSEPNVMVHSIDYFRSFIGDPYIFGQIAANHALSDIYAMNGEAVSALALCVVPYGPEQHVEDSLSQMLAGCLEILEREKCTLVGGHSSEGGEPAFGLSVNGVVNPLQVFRKGPLSPGDVIVLTKALGTGTLLAADMRSKAKGMWVKSAIESMIQTNKDAAKILHDFGCTACADVTGFGFLGHLLEMLKFKPKEEHDQVLVGCQAATINLESVPALLGAKECVEAGIFSTLQPENIRCSQAIHNIEFGTGKSIYPLLFDPQTSGGLVATIKADNAAAVVDALKRQGYASASIVGKIVDRNSEDEFAPYLYLED